MSIQLARRRVFELQPYESARSLALQGKIFLDANESPEESGILLWNRYPDPQPRVLLERFSQIYGVTPENILIGRGSDEAIDILVRTFCEPEKDGILITPPTYGVYEVSARIQGASVFRVPLNTGSRGVGEGTCSLDVTEICKQIQDQPIKLVFLCNPNNPTGTLFKKNDLLQICETSLRKAMVIVDEAYIEFCESNSTMVTEIEKFPNLVVLRTMSKAWAMAGLRCGVAIAQAPVVSLLRMVLAPYPLSSIVVQAVLEGADLEGHSRMKERVSKTKARRNELLLQLGALDSVKKVYPSEASFLLTQFKDSKRVMDHCRGRGIILRDRGSEPNLRGCIRITVGNDEECEVLLKTLRELV